MITTMTTQHIGTPQRLPIDDLTPYHENPRRGDVTAIADSLRAHGQFRPLVVNRGTDTGRPWEVLAGNHTLMAALSLDGSGHEFRTLDCYVVDVSADEARRIVLADNRTSDLGAYDDAALLDMLQGMDDLTGTGYDDDALADLLDGMADEDERVEYAAGALADDDDDAADSGPVGAADGTAGDDAAPVMEAEAARRTLAERFLVPPFTVLDTRSGRWATRKRAWHAQGIRSTVGRGESLTFHGGLGKFANWMKVAGKARAVEPGLTDVEIEEKYADDLRPAASGTGTSEFDPVLAEVLYTWFTGPGYRVLDPWAGGSVRGIVAAALGREYVGCELRAEQVEANREQWEATRGTIDAPTIDPDAEGVAAPLDLVADDRPTITATEATPGPAADEAAALYAATSSLPLRAEYTAPLPDTLHHYLALVYDAAEQPLHAEPGGPAAPWHPLPDNPNECWIAFTGGKDSVAAALQAEADGMAPVLYHLAGLNRGMADEREHALQVAAARGWRIVIERVTAAGKKEGLVELPTKNQVTALFMLNRMAAEGANRWSAGWHTTDAQHERGFGYDYSDGTEAIARFDAYLSERFPGQQYMGRLTTTTEAWAEVAAAGLLRLVKGCVCPPRYKKRVRDANERKWGPLLENRCGSCVKCAWEQQALEALGVSDPRPEYREHLQQFIDRDFAHRAEQHPDLNEWLVPADEAADFRRDDWPDQIDPAEVQTAHPEGPLPTGAQAHAGAPAAEGSAEWITGDSRATMRQMDTAAPFDFVIGCPPYYDLEEYSDDAADLSTMTTAEFDAAMIDTLRAADALLADDSFAAFVVGPARDKQGHLRDMKMLMIRAAEEIGWHYVNDAVLLNSATTAAVRAARAFVPNRTLARVHQDVVIFVKGDRRAATGRCGPVDVADLTADDDPEEE